MKQEVPASGPRRPRDGRSTRWAEHRAMRRIELLIKARGAIHQLGPAASMGEIAQLAGTSKSVFYRYFHDKQGLSQALGEFLLERLEGKISDAARRARDDRELVHGMVDAYLVMVQRSPAIHEFVTSYSGLGWSRTEESAAPTSSLGAFADHVASLLLQNFTDSEASSSLLTGTLEPGSPMRREGLSYWARAVVGMVHSVTEKWRHAQLEGEAPDRAVVVDCLTDWILAPVTAPGAAPTRGAPPNTPDPQTPRAADPMPPRRRA
ncbi:TetR/AcrR family transcriptional regulator [Rothia sp. AR01]|uniref:TetR/AcrR family transcriptional regulator n=1 Tax=Rothia santali TaxID=2949643 RepID=A0A9X2KGV9_9MICC|nr:TetR/AcrR family transcriptional regulator [Rothia santali]MCP3424538.1 TetR/AcrR family transcriptional regulator [Rothia santali]